MILRIENAFANGLILVQVEMRVSLFFPTICVLVFILYSRLLCIYAFDGEIQILQRKQM